MAQNVAPMLKKFRLAVERLVYRQHTSNRRHGSHLGRHRVMPVRSEPAMPSFGVAGQYCSLWKDCGVWMFKTDHNLWRTSKGDQYRSSSETGTCWVIWAEFASTPPRGCRAQQITTASASPSWGRFLDIRLWPFKVLVEGDHGDCRYPVAAGEACRNRRRRGVGPAQQPPTMPNALNGGYIFSESKFYYRTGIRTCEMSALSVGPACSC